MASLTREVEKKARGWLSSNGSIILFKKAIYYGDLRVRAVDKSTALIH